MLDINKVVLKKLRMRLKNGFTTSFGTVQDKEFFLVEVHNSDGITGYGESVAFSVPWYTEETVGTTEHVMTEFLIPLLLEAPMKHPDQVAERFNRIRRNHMAKAALEGAVWDLFAKQNQTSLSHALGGEHKQVEVGVSIGIQPSLDQLLQVIQEKVDQGYRRVKIKIKPGWDVEVVKTVREAFPELPLMVDANSAYTLDQIERIKKLDRFNLLMIEQPLAHDDFLDHSKLQKKIETPICLDESIHSIKDAELAVELGSCKIINIKIGRVGGLTEAKRVHDLCWNHGLPVWCGGMLEAGVGRAHSIALASLPGFTLPGDTAASAHYWERDIIQPEVRVRDGRIDVPTTPGIGFELDPEAISNYTVREQEFQRM